MIFFSDKSFLSSPFSNISFTISHPPTNSFLMYSCGIVGQSLNSFIPCLNSSSSKFNNLNKIEQHKLVYKSLKGKVGNELHALSITTEGKK